MIEESRLKQLSNAKAKATMDLVQRSLLARWAPLAASLPCMEEGTGNQRMDSSIYFMTLFGSPVLKLYLFYVYVTVHSKLQSRV